MSIRYRMRPTHDIDRRPTRDTYYTTKIEIVDAQTGKTVHTIVEHSTKNSENATSAARGAASKWIAEKEKQDAGLVTTLKGATDGE